METPRNPNQLLLGKRPVQEALFENLESPKYELLTDPEQRADYVRYTELLIAHVIADKVDDIVFLDKSARPVSWLFKELWPYLGIDDDGRPALMPQIKFANIDREQWGPIIGRSETETGGIDFNRLHPDYIDSLRGLFAKRSVDVAEYVPDSEDTMFTGRHVMVVDEVMSSGDTLVMAEKLFEIAFPDAERISGSYWVPPDVKTQKGGAKVSAKPPVWYDDHDPRGRLVGDRSSKYSLSSSTIRQRRGQYFLSTRFPFVDEKGVALKNEMHQLALEVGSGIIPVTPGSQRSDIAQDYIIEKINGVSLIEWVTLKRQAAREASSFAQIFLEYKRAKENH